MKSRKIDIIGAGICGLTTAIALEQKGFNIRIFEQAQKIDPVGAGIILANNAMQIYNKLGLKDSMEAMGNTISKINITDAKLKAMSSVSLTSFEKKYKAKNIAIHRATLQRILLENLNTAQIKLDHKLKNVEKTTNGFKLQFENGKKIQSHTLLGADGIHSMVRKCLFPQSRIREANQLCWRGVANYKMPNQYQNEFNEAWGNGKRIGFGQIAPNKVYWFALKTYKEGVNKYSNDDLKNIFIDFHPMLREIISETETSMIHTAAISDLQLIKHWHLDNVCLIGDAAHATTPNMGQGACQAIEDAHVLSACLDKFETNKAFDKFQRARMQKVQMVVNRSWSLGKVAHWKNPIAMKLRNQIMRWTPKHISIKQIEKIFELDELP